MTAKPSAAERAAALAAQLETSFAFRARVVESFDFNAALLARVKALPERVKALRTTESAA